MNFIKIFYDADFPYVGIKGVNECGEESYIIDGNSNFTISELPLDQNRIEDERHNKIFYMQYAKDSRELIKGASYIYLHILNKNSCLYHAKQIDSEHKFYRDGLIDGDILLSIENWKYTQSFSKDQLEIELEKIAKSGGIIEVRRFTGGRYVNLKFNISPGILGAEYHIHKVTDLENKLIND